MRFARFTSIFKSCKRGWWWWGGGGADKVRSASKLSLASAAPPPPVVLPPGSGVPALERPFRVGPLRLPSRAEGSNSTSMALIKAASSGTFWTCRGLEARSLDAVAVLPIKSRHLQVQPRSRNGLY